MAPRVEEQERTVEGQQPGVGAGQETGNLTKAVQREREAELCGHRRKPSRQEAIRQRTLSPGQGQETEE
jgi:hypothetical protein